MEHSADWYRGAYQLASRYAPMDVAMQINVQLVAAEARDAGVKVRGKKNADYWRGAVELLRQYKRGSIDLTHVINQCLEAYEIEKASEAGEPSAAEVIRVAKAALEEICETYSTDTLDESWTKANEAIAAIAAWEKSNEQ